VENQSVTDLSYLRKVTMGDDEIMVETIEVFIDNTPDVLKNLKKYFANEDWDKLYEQAHKVKPSLQYMGMERARQLIVEIEEQARTQNISEDLGDKIEELNSICLQGLDELSEKIEELRVH
jgi:HPt (histidine-containing phosphotransfer) domain-containing protein